MDYYGLFQVTVKMVRWQCCDDKLLTVIITLLLLVPAIVLSFWLTQVKSPLLLALLWQFLSLDQASRN